MEKRTKNYYYMYMMHQPGKWTNYFDNYLEPRDFKCMIIIFTYENY